MKKTSAAVFGRVVDKATESTENGYSATVLLIETDVYNGEPKYARCPFWGEYADIASTANIGETVLCEGEFVSRKSKRGYWNTSMKFTSLHHIGDESKPAPRQDAYENEDIPF